MGETDDAYPSVVAVLDGGRRRVVVCSAQRAKLIARRKAAYKAVHPETKQGGAPAKKSGKGGKVANLAAAGHWPISALTSR